MKRLAWLSVCLLLIALVAGCGRNSPPPSILVSGTVKSGSTPLFGAVVRLNGKAAYTDGSGNFSLIVSPGTGTLLITKVGYSTYSESVPVTAPGPLSLGEIQMTQITPVPAAESVVSFPAINNGSASFSVPVVDANSLSLVMPFAATSTTGMYSYSVAPQFESAQLNAVRSAARRSPVSSPGAVRYSRLTLIGSGLRENLGAQKWLREREAEVARRGAAIRLRPVPYLDSVGQSRTFNVLDFSSGTPVVKQITATCQRIATGAYFYVDSATTINDTTLDEWVTHWNTYRDQLRTTFGNELDVDGDSSIFILVTPIPSEPGTIVFGYFYSGNEYPTTEVPESNQCEMIVVNSAAATDTIKGTLAHEYQHMLHFSERYGKRVTLDEYPAETWISEALSTLAEDLVGYGYCANIGSRVQSVEEWLWYSYTWSLTQWDSQNYSYGGAYLFARYLYDHYPASPLSINRTTLRGTAAVVAATGEADFATIFKHWIAAVANRWVGRTSADVKDNYQTAFPLTGDIDAWVIEYPYRTGNINARVRQWGVDIVAVQGTSPTGQCQLTFGSGGSFGITVVKF